MCPTGHRSIKAAAARFQVWEEQGWDSRHQEQLLTYMALIIKLVVGQLELVKTDHLPHPGVSRSQGVRVDVNSRGHWGVSIASHHPLGAVIHIPERGRVGGWRRLLLTPSRNMSRAPPPLPPSCTPSSHLQSRENVLYCNLLPSKWKPDYPWATCSDLIPY